MTYIIGTKNGSRMIIDQFWNCATINNANYQHAKRYCTQDCQSDFTIAGYVILCKEITNICANQTFFDFLRYRHTILRAANLLYESQMRANGVTVFL